MVSNETLYAQLRDAVFDNDKARLQELLARDGVDVDHYDAGGQTLLHLACFWGRMELVKVLLNAGASLKTKNAASCTALDLATHWGHSSVAEVIRLRGGRSVWEDKLGHLQVQVEDLKLQALASQSQLFAKKRDFDTLSDDFHRLHTRYEEAKTAHALSEHALAKAQLEIQALNTEVACLQAALEKMTTNFHQTLIEKASAEHLQVEYQREAQAVIAHRDEILRTMQDSVLKQETAAHNWQKAEVAAAIAESQRNFAFAERDQFQKKHVVALGELLVLTARLDAAEEELMGLKIDLAEHIYEKKREQKVKKRAERALSHVYGPGPGTAGSGVESFRGSVTTSSTPPVSTQQSQPLTTPLGKQQSPLQSQASSSTLSSSTAPTNQSTPSQKKKKKYFSLAAREFGEHLRAEELKKQKERVKRHERVENQYLTQGLNAKVRASDQFQEEFVTKVQSFATARSAQWKELKKERDKQFWFTKSVLARPIATAPHSLGVKADESLGLGLGGNLDAVEDVPSHSLTSPLDGKRRTTTSKKKTSGDGTVNYAIYSKYARPAYLDNSLRPVTSPLEVRMQHSYFSAVGHTKAAETTTCDDPGSGTIQSLDKADLKRSEPEDGVVPGTTSFLPRVK